MRFDRGWWNVEVQIGGVRLSRRALVVWLVRVAVTVVVAVLLFGCAPAPAGGYRLVVGDSLTHGAFGHPGFAAFMSGDRSLVGGAGESPLDGPGEWRDTAVGIVGRRGAASVVTSGKPALRSKRNCAPNTLRVPVRYMQRRRRGKLPRRLRTSRRRRYFLTAAVSLFNCFARRLLRREALFL